MFKRARYVHRKHPYGEKFNGFSVQLIPSDIEGNVCVRVTFCSKDDIFSKKKAREALDYKPMFHVPIRNLPSVLAGYDTNCYAMVKHATPGSITFGNSWAWVWKYFL